MGNETPRDQIRAVIDGVPRPGMRKCGNLLHDAIVVALRTLTTFRIVKEDEAQFLQAQMPVWRGKLSNEVEPTHRQRRIDIVVYDDDIPIALIEVESDLDDLKVSGVSSRNGHYDIFSVAKSADGQYFHSYKSLERMAAAAFYYHLHQRDQIYPDAKSAIEKLELVTSDRPDDHNPSQLPIFLVSGSCRAIDRGILDARLKSLGAELICKS
jgi:hypothetical protein